MPTTRACLLAALFAIALTAATTAPAHASCAAGKTGWTLEGKAACAPALEPAAEELRAALARTWVERISKNTKGAGTRVPRKLRKLTPRIANAAAKLVVARPDATPKARARAADAPAEASEFGTYELPAETSTLPGGVELTVTGRAIQHDYGDIDAEMEIEARHPDGTRLRYEPVMDDMRARVQEIGCPTADGAVLTTVEYSTGGTLKVFRKRRLVGARTEKMRAVGQVRGVVEPDARLGVTAVDVTIVSEHYERGLQQKVTVRAQARAPRDGVAAITGTPGVDASVKLAGATKAETTRLERKAARAYAADLPSAMASIVEDGRRQLLRAEPGWYEIPNPCAEASLTPYGMSELRPGQEQSVTGTTIATRDGGEAEGTFTITAVDRGTFAAGKPGFGPGDPARFTARATTPDDDHSTVFATVIASSRAGRARDTWNAAFEPPAPPKAYEGSLSAFSDWGGSTHDWEGTGTWTRTSLETFPDGSVSAWYELTAASVSFAEGTIGDTNDCHYFARSSGGEIDVGDLEIRVLPDGRRLYTILYDLKVEATFTGRNCHDGQPDPMDDHIYARLYTAIPGPVDGRWREAGPDWTLKATNRADVTTLPGTATAASWELTPAG